VGNISAVNIYTMAKAAEHPSLPILASTSSSMCLSTRRLFSHHTNYKEATTLTKQLYYTFEVEIVIIKSNQFNKL